jgi:hypothetical protein
MDELIKQISALLTEYEKNHAVEIVYLSLKRDTESGKRKVKTVFRGEK